jgi:SAM-dependent methyltransferase
VGEIKWTDEKVTRLWGYYSSNPSYRAQYFSYHSGKYILNYINRHVKLGRLESVLDFGCGPGHLIEHLLKIVGRGKVFGIDYSKEAVEQVNHNFSKHKSFAKAVWADSMPSSFADNSMDMVISIEVIEHLDDKQLEGVFKEIYRILKPGGFVIITTPNEEDLQANKTICPECGSIFHRWQHVRTWSAESLEAYLSSAGFKTRLVNATFFQSTTDHIITTIIKIKHLLLRKKADNFLPHLIAIAEK